jgi:hypothetical protein
MNLKNRINMLGTILWDSGIQDENYGQAYLKTMEVSI